MPIDFSFLEENAPQKKEPKKGLVFVTLRVDADCVFKCDGEEIVSNVIANETVKVQLPIGNHLLEFISIECPAVRIEKHVNYKEAERNYIEIENGLNELIIKNQPIAENPDQPKEDLVQGCATVTLRADEDCVCKCDGVEIVANMVANETTNVQIPIGNHFLEFISVKFPAARIEKHVDYADTGKNYVEIVNGLSELVNKYRPTIESAQIKKIDFAQVWYKNGKEVLSEKYITDFIKCWASTVRPLLKYSLASSSEKVLEYLVKIIYPDGHAEDRDNAKLTLSPGDNRVLLEKFEIESFASFGEYKYQFWHKDILLYETIFTIRSMREIICVKKIDFDVIDIYGKHSYSSEIDKGVNESLIPRMIYSCNIPQYFGDGVGGDYFYSTQIVFPDGKVEFKDSYYYAGYWGGSKFNVESGEKIAILHSFSGILQTGEYIYRFYFVGDYTNYKRELLYETKFIVKDSVAKDFQKNVTIKNVDFAFIDKDGHVDDYGTLLVQEKKGPISVRIVYSCNLPSEYKMLLHSKLGERYTEKKLVKLQPGVDNQVCLNIGYMIDQGATGEFKYQLLFDKMLLYETNFSIKRSVDFFTINQIEFANVDKGTNRIIDDYDSKVKDRINYLRARISYSYKLPSEGRMYISQQYIYPNGCSTVFPFETVTLSPGESNFLYLEDRYLVQYRGETYKQKGRNKPGIYKYNLISYDRDPREISGLDLEKKKGQLIYEGFFTIKMAIEDVKFAAYHRGPKGECVCDFGTTIKQVRNLNNCNKPNFIDCLVLRFYYQKTFEDSNFEIDLDITLNFPNGDSMVTPISITLNSGVHESLYWDIALNLGNKILEYGKYTYTINQAYKDAENEGTLTIYDSYFYIEKRSLFDL